MLGKILHGGGGQTLEWASRGGAGFPIPGGISKPRGCGTGECGSVMALAVLGNG